jgi:hypothetical protein
MDFSVLFGKKKWKLDVPSNQNGGSSAKLKAFKWFQKTFFLC